MSAGPRKSLGQSKEARQKKVLAVLGVVLIAVLGFQLPKLMKGDDSAPPVDTTIVTQAAAPPATLPENDSLYPPPLEGQLVSFSLFRAKDPFVQQVKPDPEPDEPAPITPKPPTTTAPQSTTPTKPSSTTPRVPTPPVPPSTGSPPPATEPAAPTSAFISTNGVCEEVKPAGVFPATSKLFELVSIARDGKSVQIGIADGKLEGGAPSVELERGKPLTLVNTTDGIRYTLSLLAACPVVATPTGTTPTGTIPTTTTPVATVSTTTVSTTTTPVVIPPTTTIP